MSSSGLVFDVGFAGLSYGQAVLNFSLVLVYHSGTNTAMGLSYLS